MADKSRYARSPYGFKLFSNQETDWNFKRTLEPMSEKAAESGECLYAARRIKPNDGESWIKEWAALAARVEALAEESQRGGHLISAREGFLRACNYYRAAEYGCGPDHARFQELWQKSVQCLHQACPLFDPPVQPIQVPFEGKLLPGYFWRPDHTTVTRPTLMAAGGNDSSGEEMLIATGPAAVRRGYNYFTFEYPGHRGTVHLYPDCVKRPDYEVPFRAAIDFLGTLPGVDDRLALVGYSYGGYVVSRVAIHEKRLKAVIPDSPIVDWPKLSMSGVGSLMKRLPPARFEQLINWKVRRSPLMKSLIEYSRWTWGARTYAEQIALPSMKAHVITDDLHRITCPALALVGADEGERMLQQAQWFYEGISSKQKRLHVFSLERDGSSDHCQFDNLSRGSQVIYDWLDDVFDYRYSPINH